MFGGEKKGLVHYEEVIACFSLLPSLLAILVSKEQ